ncbi:MAG: HD domain-containing protein [Sedimentisphaerales bacterium]|nr:HD domain-containing protein [Sedimentisphaerales bacterium]
MQKSELPTRQQCFGLLKKYRVPEHIVAHSLAVAKLAVFLAERLKENTLPVDVELVERASILHDLVRVCDFEELDYRKFKQAVTKEDRKIWTQIRAKYGHMCHEDAAYEILRDDWPLLALVIKRHNYLAMLTEKDRPNTWEEKILFYADARVMHDKISTLEERLSEGHKRNVHLHGSLAQSKINTSRVDPMIYSLEKEIFEKIKFNPIDVTDVFIDSYPSMVQKINYEAGTSG